MNCYGAHAIEFAGVNNGVIRNCSITGFRYGSNNFTAEAIQLDICYSDKKDGEWTPGFDLDKTTCQNILIENNTITDYPRGVGVHHLLKGHQVTNVTIQNNKFVRSSASTQGKSVVGIFLYGVQNATVYNNTFDRYSYGAMIKVSKQVTVKKNTFKYNNLGSLIVEGCDSNNGRHTFVVTSDDIGKKVLKFTRGNIKKGTVKTRGRTYKFKKTGEVTLKLKKKIKVNQKITFYGKDTSNNKYYRIYYVPKQEKKTSK
jgi:parallel beta-helix repeat protein